MIQVSNLIYDYPGTRALDDVSFTIRAGSITALVGPNGAGKTTLLRCLAALEEPVSGRIAMEGRDILDDPRAIHRKLGYLSDFFGLYEELTVQQCLQYAAMSHALPVEQQGTVIKRVAGQLDLADRLAGLTGYTRVDMVTTEPPAKDLRRIRCCIAGEPVCVQGIGRKGVGVAVELGAAVTRMNGSVV